MRPFTRRQADQNAAFLEALARTGNARLAAGQLGVHRGTYFKRRAKSPAFAAQWAEALRQSQAVLNPPRNGEGDHSATPNGGGAGRRPRTPHLRTKGAETVLVRLGSGRVQLRRARPGTITPAAETAFLQALAASANIRLSAAAAGFAHTSFLARARRDPAFAAAMAGEIEAAADRLAFELVERAGRSAADHYFDADVPIPEMTVHQALLQLHFHREDSRFQRRRPRFPPRPFAEVRPRILARLELIERARRYERSRRGAARKQRGDC